jgi:preprotein translocase subunit YajC
MLYPILLALVQEAAPAATPAGGAPGQAAQPGMGDMFGSMLVPMLLCMVVFWIFMIGPERKQRKKREEMLKNLSKGDEVVLTSGIYGSIVQVQDDKLTLEIASGVRIKTTLQSVAGLADAKAAEGKPAEIKA